MSDGRALRLETSIKRRLVDARRHLAALEHAAAGFGVDFDLAPFAAAWSSDEPETLERAYIVQAGYENVINVCVKVAQELVSLERWSASTPEPSSVEALRLLQENGVIPARTRIALKEAQERRNDIQHDYVNVAGRELHAAARAVLEHAPWLLQGVADALRRRP